MSGVDGVDAGLALNVSDGGRSRTEDVEQVTTMSAAVTETDAPPEVAVYAGDRRWNSADGGISWRTGNATAVGASDAGADASHRAAGNGAGYRHHPRREPRWWR